MSTITRMRFMHPGAAAFVPHGVQIPTRTERRLHLTFADAAPRRAQRGERSPTRGAVYTFQGWRLGRRTARRVHAARDPRRPGGIARASMPGSATTAAKEDCMNRDTFKGTWNQVKGNVRKQWGKLTDDDVDQIQGDAEIMLGKIQQRYGRSKDQASQEFDRWLGTL